MNSGAHLFYGLIFTIIGYLISLYFITYYLPIWILLSGALFGTMISDFDLHFGVKYHRSPITHGGIIPVLLLLMIQPSPYLSPTLETQIVNEYASFVLFGLATHLFLDLIPSRGPLTKKLETLFDLSKAPGSIRGISSRAAHGYLISSAFISLTVGIYLLVRNHFLSLSEPLFIFNIFLIIPQLAFTGYLLWHRRASMKLTILRGVTSAKAEVLVNAGVTNLRELANADSSKLSTKTKFSVDQYVDAARSIVILYDSIPNIHLSEAKAMYYDGGVDSMEQLALKTPTELYNDCKGKVSVRTIEFSIKIAQLFIKRQSHEIQERMD